MKFIILDTETTGTKEEDRIIQLSFLVTDENNEIEEIEDTLCKPPLPISYEAMAVHHITPEMLENAETIHNTKSWDRLNELNIFENIMVIHNAKFDIEMLFKEDFENNLLKDAERSLAYNLVIEAIGKVEGITATPEEREAKYEEIATQYNMGVEQVKAAVNEQAIESEVVYRKTIDFLVDNLEVE